ncbi:MAG TPA: DeoR/GlpR transcriptional regulator [Clostridiales bacterium]|nr:DeoR/GlpR transcriptional regulator [Clostridiales bacterium]
MLPEARREEILAYIRNVKNATSEELSKRFKVTEETIRKDLKYLANRGFIIRTFGGAMIKAENNSSFDRGAVTNHEEDAIAQKASSFIDDSESIILDAGSANVQLAKYIRENSDVVVVTNSLRIINIISKMQGITVISTGGTLRTKSMSFQGQLAEYTIEKYNIHKAFISAKGVSLDEGVMDSNELEAEIKRKMIAAAKEVILLVDHTKFGKITHVTVCPIDKVTTIVTDDKTHPEILQAYKDRGIDIAIGKLENKKV